MQEWGIFCVDEMQERGMVFVAVENILTVEWWHVEDMQGG